MDSTLRGPEYKMDKYAVQAGDGTYDSDAEADDEFERSAVGMTSPTLPLQCDEEHEYHSSDSEDHESVDGEDTPTTQGWADGRSPRANIKSWTAEQVAEYVASLSPSLKQYGPAITEESIDGFAIVHMHHDELREVGVNSVGHRLSILRAVYEQKIRAGLKIEENDYVPLSAEGDKGDLNATQDDIARVIESIRLRDQRIIAAESELRAMRDSLDRISEENKKLREETLPMLRLMKDQRTPLPDPSGGTIPSPREVETAKQGDSLGPPKESKGSSLSRKFSTKKLFLGGAPKQPSPTHPPQAHTPQPREVRDDGGAHLEASAAALAASTHLTASMHSQTSPNSVHGHQLSPTSPAYSTHGPQSGGGPQHYPGSAGQRSFPRDGSSSARHDPRAHMHGDDTNTGFPTPNQWGNQAGSLNDPTGSNARQQDRRRVQAPTPSPREDEAASTRERDRGDKDNPQVEIFKSFRVSIEDPCRVVLPVALKRYNITDDWRQYALYIVHGDQERCLGLEEKPLMLFKQLDKEGRKPMFMLRRHAAPAEGWSHASNVAHNVREESAGAGGQQQGTKSIPGGVL